jgi:hypothetical protein
MPDTSERRTELPNLGHDVERDTIEALECAGSRVRGGRGRWRASCPHPDHGKGRGDRDPSLGLVRTSRGILPTCFGGCDRQQVLDSLGFTFADLFDDAPRHDLTPEVVHGKEWAPEWVQRTYATEFRVLHTIHDLGFNGPSGIRISQEKLGRLLGLARETVNRACAWLRRMGLLDWHQERRPGSVWRHNVYRLCVTWTRPYRVRMLKRLDAIRSLTTSRFATDAKCDSHPQAKPPRAVSAAVSGTARPAEARAGP